MYQVLVDARVARVNLATRKEAEETVAMLKGMTKKETVFNICEYGEPLEEPEE